MATPEAGQPTHFPVNPYSAHSSRRSSRRSWFDTPPATKLEIAVEKPAPKPPQGKNKRRSIDEIETLVLTHFTKPPRIGFGKIILGRSKTRILMVQNPNDYEQEVVIERFPFKKCFNIDQTRFTVGPNDVVSLTLTWTPQEAGSCREMILFHVNDVYRLQAYVFGTADDPKPPKKVRKGMLGAHKVKQPLTCVVQTPALNNIRDSYSPCHSEEIRELQAKLQQQQARLTNQENIQPAEPEEIIPQTPPPLESTAICKPDELFQQNAIERQKSGFSSPTISTMSPIPVTADNINGCIIESYFCPGTDQTHLSAERKVSTERSPLASVPVDDNSKFHAQRKNSHGQQPLHSVHSPLTTKGGAADVQVSPQTKKITFIDGKYCISPNSFLNDFMATKKPSTPEIGKIKPSKQMSKVKEVGVTSPNSFLEDLTSGRNTLKVDSEKVVSPSAVLNSSIPHDIMLRQLETVRTSLHEGSFHAEMVTQTATAIRGKMAKVPGRKGQQLLKEKTTRNVFAYAHSTDATNLKKKEKFLQRKVQERAHFAKITDAPSPRRKTFLVKKKQVKISPTRRHAQASKMKKDTLSKGKLVTESKKGSTKIVTATADAQCKKESEMAVDEPETSTQAQGQDDLDNTMTKRRRSQWASPAVTGFILPVLAANPDSPMSTAHSTDKIIETPKHLCFSEVNTPTMQESKLQAEETPQPESLCDFSNCGIALSTGGKADEQARAAEGNDSSQKEAAENDVCQCVERKLFPEVVTGESFSESFKSLLAGNSETVTKARPVSPHTSGMANSSGRRLFPDLHAQNTDQNTVVPVVNTPAKEAGSENNSKSSAITSHNQEKKSIDSLGVGLSPVHFEFRSPQALATNPAVEATRRATLTVTKPQPSQALLDAHGKRESATGRQNTSNILTSRKQEIDDDVWETETIIIEQRNSQVVSVSFHREYLTPSELPSSPKSENSRRSTHAVKNPVVLSKEGMVRKNLFAPVEEASINQQVPKMDQTVVKEMQHEGKEELIDRVAVATDRSQASGGLFKPAVFTDRVEHHLTSQHPQMTRRNQFSAVDVPVDVSASSQELTTDSLDPEGKATTIKEDEDDRGIADTSKRLQYGASAEEKTSESYTDRMESTVDAIGDKPDHGTHHNRFAGRSLREGSLTILSTNSAASDHAGDESTSSTLQDKYGLSVSQKSSSDPPLEKLTEATLILPCTVVKETLLKEAETSIIAKNLPACSEGSVRDRNEGWRFSHVTQTPSADTKAETSGNISQNLPVCLEGGVRDGKEGCRSDATQTLIVDTVSKTQSSHSDTKGSTMDKKHPKLHRTVSTEIPPKAKPVASGMQRATSQTGLHSDNTAAKSVPLSNLKHRNLQASLKGSSRVESRPETFNANGKRLSPEAPKGQPRQKKVELDASCSQKGAAKLLLVTSVSGKVNAGKGSKAVKGVAQSKLILVKKPKTALPKHPLPFAAKNIYYDERWQDKQERGFVHWLNFVLTPSDEYNLATTKKKVDARTITFDGPASKVALRLAPTKEVLSFRAYAARRRLNHLRRASCRLFQSEDVARVVCRVELEVENRRLAVRTDRMIHADIGIKQRILDMLLSYNPLWLRIGLETVYGEVLQLQSNNDVVGLSRFILTRMLSSPDIAAQYAHPTVPHLYQDGYSDAVAQHTLKKFLLLVYFLDSAKRSCLIAHNPCLFCKDSEVKSTKEVLVNFSRDYLSGEGDITKHLAYLGYVVSHVQTPIDEFDYAVTNLCTDLRDGIRLGRIVMLLSGDWGVVASLRTPAISRLQKIHNVEVVFKYLTCRGFDLSTAKGSMLNPRDIVDGHREKTLAFLWKLIFHFQTVASLNEAELQEEVDMLERTLRVRLCMQQLLLHLPLAEGMARRDSGAPGIQMETPLLQLLLKWARLVCLHYGVRVENFTVSFSDGRALCCLLHHYHPALLPLDRVRFQTTQSYQEAAEAAEEGTADGESDLSQGWGASPFGGETDPGLFEKLLANERENFKTLYEKVSELGGVPLMLKASDMSNTIPDERIVITYVSYMCARLLDLRQETRAARIIQLAWRRYSLRRSARERRRKIDACITIQRAVRAYLAKIRAEREEAAAAKIQATWRGHQGWVRAAVLRQAQLNHHVHDTAITLQTQIRSHLTRKRFLEQRAAAIMIQTWFRGRQAQHSFEKRHQACLLIQSYFHSHQKMAAARSEFLAQRCSAVILQRAFRKRRERIVEERNRAACVLQTAWRGTQCRRDFARKKHAVTSLQLWWKMIRARKQFLKLKSTAVAMQRRFRATRLGSQAQREFLQAKSAAIILQKVFRAHQQRRQYQTKKMSAITIQKNFRRYKCRVKFQAVRLAAVVIQRAVRAQQAWNRAQREYFKMQHACITIQRWYERQKKQQAAKREAAAVKIQSHLRGLLAHRKLQALHVAAKREAAATKIQAFMRGSLAKRKYQRLLCSVVMLQAYVRGHQARRQYAEIREALIMLAEYTQTQEQFQLVVAELHQRWSAAVHLQAWWRGCHQRKSYQTARHGVVCLQAVARGRIERSRYHRLHKATLTLQRYYRAWRLGRSVNLQYQLLVGAAVVFQSCWKMHVVRRCYLHLQGHVIKAQAYCRKYLAVKRYQRMKNAAVCIQRHFRARQVGRQVREVFLASQKAAVHVQAFARGCQQRRHYLATRESCTKIQVAVRGWLTRRSYQRQYAAIVALQRRWRKLLLCRQAQNEYLHSRQAAIRLQAYIRGWLQRRHFLQTRDACIKIQSTVRIWRAVRHYHAQKQAAVTLQHRWRAVLLGRAVCTHYTTMRRSIIKIQTVTRGYLARKHLSQLYQAAITIQTTYRCHRQQQAFLQQRRAAVILQKHIRAFLQGRQQKREYATIQKACITIQAYHRGYATRRQYHKTRERMVKLQAAIRGYQQRQRYQSLVAVTMICQRRFRAKCLGLVFRAAFLLIRDASVVIQKHTRGYIARQQYQRQRSVVIILQARTRGWLSRRETARKLQAVCILQKYVRAWLARKSARESYIQTRQAAVTMQRAWRSHRQHVAERRYSAAAIIQKNFRRLRAQQQYHSQLSKIIHLQACVRGMIAQRKFRAEKMAAMEIQRRWREMLAARACHHTFMLQLGAAVVIQTAFRRYRIRGYYLLAVKRVVLLQAAFRGCMQKRQYQKLRQTVLLLQQRVRQNATVRRERNSFLAMRASAICIQRVYRKWQERQLSKKIQAATLLQSHVRRMLVQREYILKRNAAVVLPAALCAHRARQDFLQKRSAIVTFQRRVRWFLMVRRLHEEVHRRQVAAAIIQRACRRHQAHKRWCRLLHLRESICKTQAAYCLQRVVRSWLARRKEAEIKRKMAAVIVLQRSFRAWRAQQAAEEEKQRRRKEFLERFTTVARKHLAVVQIQHWYHQCVLLRQAKERLHSIVMMQSWVRMFLQRQRFLRAKQEALELQKRREVMACVIQSAVRRWRARRAEKQQVQLITKVQAVWRGRRLRRSLNNKKIAAARKRVQEANEAATEEKKLGNRTCSALDFLLHYKQLAYILDALMHLDVATRLSSVCCERLVEVNAVSVIYRLIQSCNRSLPHMELIKYSVNILLNLAKYEKTTPAVYVVEDSVSTLVDLMSIYREKGGTIFTKTCMLLAILGLDAERKEAMCANKRFVEKLQSIHVLVLRKHKMQVARAQIAARSSLSATLPSCLHAARAVKVRPAWVLKRDSTHEIEDPLAALSFLLDTLHIGPQTLI